MYLLSVRDDHHQDGGHTAEDDDDSEGQQRPLGVAHRLGRLADPGHHVGGPDLQDASPGRQVELEVLVDVQQFTV